MTLIALERVPRSNAHGIAAPHCIATLSTYSDVTRSFLSLARPLPSPLARSRDTSRENSRISRTGATPRSPGPPGDEGERSRANGAIFGRGRRARQHEEFKEVRRLFARIQKMRRIAFVRRGESHRRDLLLCGADVFFFFDAGVFFVDVSGARFFVPVLKVVGCVRKPLSSWRGIT